MCIFLQFCVTGRWPDQSAVMSARVRPLVPPTFLIEGVEPVALAIEDIMWAMHYGWRINWLLSRIEISSWLMIDKLLICLFFLWREKKLPDAGTYFNTNNSNNNEEWVHTHTHTHFRCFNQFNPYVSYVHRDGKKKEKERKKEKKE